MQDELKYKFIPPKMKIVEYFFNIFCHHKLFFKYCIGGGMAAVVDIILLYIFTEYLGVYYLFSAAISFLCAAIVNYSFNKRFTFQNESKKIVQQFFLFLSVVFVGECLNLSIMYFLVTFFDIWYIVAKFISIGIVLSYNFTCNKKITFELFK